MRRDLIMRDAAGHDQPVGQTALGGGGLDRGGDGALVLTRDVFIADQQQAEERQQAAQSRLTEANLDLVNTAASFRTLTGLDLVDGAALPPSLANAIPGTLEEALARARERNPRVREAQADLDSAHSMVSKAKAEMMPTLSLEGNARIGDDIDGFRGETNDLQAGVVMRWTSSTAASNVRKSRK